MKTDNIFLVLCGTLALVVLINAGILVALLRSDTSGQLKVLGKAFEAVKNPLSKGDEDLKELRQRVSKFEDQSTEETENDN
jgi:hypothetical protein